MMKRFLKIIIFGDIDFGNGSRETGLVRSQIEIIVSLSQRNS